MLDFDNYQTEAIKIDTRPFYKCDVESDWFTAWQQGIRKPITNSDWLTKIAARTNAGARHIRIKLNDETNKLATDMRQCAIELIYPSQIAAGAEIYFMNRTDFYNIVNEIFPDGWQPNDFWLFDMTSGIEQFYTDDFEYRDCAPMSDEITKKYIALRNAVMASDKLTKLCIPGAKNKH